MEPHEYKLLDLLSNKNFTFYIPPYQRNYEWSAEQCNVFFDDVEATCKKNMSGIYTEHFFGTVTYFNSKTAFGQPDKLILIDGQQRITTTMLLLAAIRDSLDDKEYKNIIDSNYLKNNNASDESEYKIKLKQVEADWDAYKNIILEEKLNDKEKTSNVYCNYKLFMKRLADYSTICGNDIKKLIEEGLLRFSIITIELNPERHSWENPQEIFESMNSLGKPLSLADLVRNYLLLGLNAKTQEEYYHKYWLHIENTLPGQTSNYIRDYMQWRAGMAFKQANETNCKNLYACFKDQQFYDGNPEKILQDLSKNADLYKRIISGPGATEKTEKTEKTDKILEDLRRLHVTTAYSFLLALLSNWNEGRFSDSDIADLLEAFCIYCKRRRLIGLTAAENKAFPRFVNQMRRLECATDKKKELFDMLSQTEYNLRCPNDTEIEKYLESANFYNYQYNTFYLALIEENITKSRPDLNDKRLQVEHIMPQTLDDEWKRELGSDWDNVHQKYLHDIGNLTLIRHNQELGNKSFQEKKDTYINKAGLQIAKTKITDKAHWDKDAIIDRHNWIVTYLVEKVLPIPLDMRKTNNFGQNEKHGLSFDSLGLIGENIQFCKDRTISVRVVSDKLVEFEGKEWKLSPLTREIMIRRGEVNRSGAYQGAQYWEYDGMKLALLI